MCQCLAIVPITHCTAVAGDAEWQHAPPCHLRSRSCALPATASYPSSLPCSPRHSAAKLGVRSPPTSMAPAPAPVLTPTTHRHRLVHAWPICARRLFRFMKPAPGVIRLILAELQLGLERQRRSELQRGSRALGTVEDERVVEREVLVRRRLDGLLRGDAAHHRGHSMHLRPTPSAELGDEVVGHR